MLSAQRPPNLGSNWTIAFQSLMLDRMPCEMLQLSRLSQLVGLVQLVGLLQLLGCFSQQLSLYRILSRQLGVCSETSEVSCNWLKGN